MTNPTPYRVAMVAACPFPSLRGSQVLIRELAEGLAAAGNAVHVVTYPSAQHMVPVQRIAIHRVPKLPGLWTARPFGWQKAVLDLFLLWLLYRVVKRERIQIIHAHNLEGPLIAYIVRFMTGIPVVYHAHNALSDELPCYFRSRATRRLAARLGAYLDRRVARSADFSIALSERLAALLAVCGAAGRVTTVPPAIGHVPAGGGVPVKSKGGPVIMYAGNLDPYQNLECLLEGFARVYSVEPRARLVLVTHKGAHPETQQRAATLARWPGVSVRVVRSFAAAGRELRRADVLVCPRTSWSGFPIKVLNYMALGRPIVHARASAHAISDGVNGVVFSDDDPISLAGAILRVARDPSLGERLGRHARATVRDLYAWPRVLPRILNVYRQVVERRGRGRRHQREPLTERFMNDTRGCMRDNDEIPVRDARVRGLTLFCLAMLLIAMPGCGSKQPEPLAPLPPLAVSDAAPAVETESLYLLQPGDVLRVKFLYHPELDVRVPVRPDGSVSIQGVGELAAQGKTAKDLAEAIEVMSSGRLRDPEVTVIVAEVGPRRVYVGGEVRLPGPVVFREGMTPLQAILDRGGFTEVARTDSVLHLTVKDNMYYAKRLDFSGNIEEGAPELRALSVYDVIYVPRTFIGDANAFVRLYIRGLIPTIPRLGVGLTP